MHISELGVKNTVDVHLSHPTSGLLFADKEKKKPVIITLCSAIYASVYLGRDIENTDEVGFKATIKMLSRLTVSTKNLEGLEDDKKIDAFYSNPDNLWICLQLVARINEENNFLG